MNEPVLDKIALTVYIGIAVMLLLIISFLVTVLMTQRRKWKMLREMQQLKEQQQNQLIEAAIRSEEGERHRIAEQLHDEVGAILSSARLHFSNIKETSLDERDNGLFDKSKLLLDDAIQKVRGISHNLHSTLLKEFGLNEAISHFLNKTVQGTLIHVEVNLDESYHIQNPQTDIGIYRIVQELVNNALKHAKATQIKFISKVEKEMLILKIYYNGNGLSQHQFEELRYKPEGLGLKNIMNRIILLKGSIQYDKTEKETCITLSIPIMPEK